MSLTDNLIGLADAVGDECKAIRTLINGNAANLSALTTTAKTNLIVAVNELKATIYSLTQIDDAVVDDDSTWSSQKITQAIDAALDSVINGSTAGLDSLQEIAAAIGNDPNFAATMQAALNTRIRYDIVQSLSDTQKARVRLTVDAASATNVGDTDVDFATIFNTGLL